MRPSPIRSFRRPSRSSGARSRKCGRAAPRWNRKARAGNDRRTRIGTRMSDKGMFGNLGNLMKQAQAMQERLAKVQAEVATKTVQASAGGGRVTVVANGAMGVVSVEIDSEVLKANHGEMLQDLVVAATNEALRKAREMVAEEMKGITGGAPNSRALLTSSRDGPERHSRRSCAGAHQPARDRPEDRPAPGLSHPQAAA